MDYKVGIIKVKNRQELKEATSSIVNILGGMEKVIKPGDMVVIKPNVLCGRPAETGATVCPEIVEALVELAYKSKASQVIIAEAANMGIDTMWAFEICGYPTVAKKTGVKLVDLKKDVQVKVKLSGRMHDYIELPKTILDADVVINVPVLKTHNQTKVSISLKNVCVGVCTDNEKRRVIHSIGLFQPLPDELFGKGSGLDYMISDVSAILPTDFVIVDGFYGMQGMGAPIKGEPVGAKILIAGTNRVAVDAISCLAMSIDPYEIPHIKLAYARGLGEIDPQKIEVIGTPVEEIKKKFKSSLITDLSPMLPDNVELICKNACYSCISNFGYFLSEHSDSLKKLGPLTVIIGKTKIEDIPTDKRILLYYGNCAGEQMYGGSFVPGCVPRSRRQVFLALGIPDEYKSFEGLKNDQ